MTIYHDYQWWILRVSLPCLLGVPHYLPKWLSFLSFLPNLVSLFSLLSGRTMHPFVNNFRLYCFKKKELSQEKVISGQRNKK